MSDDFPPASESGCPTNPNGEMTPCAPGLDLTIVTAPATVDFPVLATIPLDVTATVAVGEASVPPFLPATGAGSVIATLAIYIIMAGAVLRLVSLVRRRRG